jgi:hypothetical protein
MNKRWLYIVLLVLCLLTIALQVSGGLEQSLQAVHHVTPGKIVVPGPRALIIDITSFISWILGIILTIRGRQWKWMMLVAFTSYAGGTLYALRSLFFQRPSTNDAEPATSL